MVTSKEAAGLIGIGAFVYLLSKIPTSKAIGGSGIVASEPVIYGLCSQGKCTVGETVYIYITFTNKGSGIGVANLSIKVNDNVVKQVDGVSLVAGQEMTLTYEMSVEEQVYQICGVVS